MSELRELTGKQAKFVIAFTSDPSCIGKVKEAAIAAGYSAETAHEIGRQTLAKPHIKTAVMQANFDQISGPLATKAVAVLDEIMTDPAAPKAVRVEAAKTILDRAGISAVRTPIALVDLTKKDISKMTPAELNQVVDDARHARERIEAQLKDITPQPAQIEAHAIAVDEAGG